MFMIYGSYPDLADAAESIDILLDMGLSRHDIRVISKQNLDEGYILENIDEDEEEDSTWDRIKDAFIFHEYEDDFFEKDLEEGRIKYDEDLLDEYIATLNAGGVIILVNENAMPKEAYDSTFKMDAGMEEILEPHREDINLNDPEQIPLKDQDRSNKDKFMK